MKQIEEINLSFKCKLKSTDLNPCNGGFHCNTCNEKVFDFRNKSANELAEILASNNNICGVFTPEQMQAQKNRGYLKRIAASLFMALGLSSFSKTVLAQDHSPKKKCPPKESQPVANDHEIMGKIVSPRPTYKNGGEEGMYNFIKSNVHNVNGKAKGKVLVSFTVDTSGNTTNIQIQKGIDPITNNEVIRVIKLLKFEPATMGTRKYPSYYSVPVTLTSNK